MSLEADIDGNDCLSLEVPVHVYLLLLETPPFSPTCEHGAHLHTVEQTMADKDNSANNRLRSALFGGGRRKAAPAVSIRSNKLWHAQTSKYR
ncbi:predicted protein [Plenodomus lingam JN3]|uniref:Predicted protein n=1 Tax=Leptosphaeria maculans (strain JN3 / isolate v23.1.3 / race Av1-4-5-6-7-8) TaxID=985895 RepID=E4ZW53_LEPMJ|nr:predicted protein [Plenodomus lingam JN3]CBX95829.1 predicted protein [Plenodomus lingam JN3]